MTKIKRAACLLILPAFLISCGKPGTREASKADEAVKVELLTVDKKDLQDVYEISGSVSSRNPANLVAKVMGTVSEVRVVEGQQVAKGQLLAVIDAPDVAASSDRAYAGLQESDNALDVARKNAELAEATFKRYEKLYAEKAISQQEYDTVRTRRDVAADELNRAKASARGAHAERERAGAFASYLRITAPVSGIVTRKAVSVGTVVMPGAALMTVETGDRLRIEVSADESLVNLVRRGMDVPVYLDAMKKDVTGKVSEFTQAIDPATRTFSLKIDLPSDQMIKLGMSGTARIPRGVSKKIMIPAAALYERGQLIYVYAVGADSRLVMRLVRPGRSSGGFVEILSGLDSGDRIVKSVGNTVHEGMKVSG